MFRLHSQGGLVTVLCGEFSVQACNRKPVADLSLGVGKCQRVELGSSSTLECRMYPYIHRNLMLILLALLVYCGGPLSAPRGSFIKTRLISLCEFPQPKP